MDNASSLFRPDAEAQLDRPHLAASGLQVVRPGLGALVASLVLLLLGAVATAVLVQVPISMKGHGVLLSSKGVLQITVSAGHEGRIAGLLVDVGERVVPGQAVARVSQPSLENELRLAESERDHIAEEFAWVRRLQARVVELSDGVRSQQERNARESIGLLEQRLAILERLQANQEGLRQSGNLTVDRQLQVAGQLADARERLASRRSEVLAIVLERNEKQAAFERELQALATRQAQAERQIQRLQDRIQNETVVKSTEHGIVTEVKVSPGSLVRYDTPLLSLLPVDESFKDNRPGEARLMAAVLVPAEGGKKVRPGMSVLVDPSSVRRDVYGAIEGVVSRTPDVASSPEELRLMLGNDELVRKFTAAGELFVLRVELQRSPDTPTGFRWTTSNGPDGTISAGTLIEAEVVTEHVRLIGLVLPALRQWFRGPEARRGAV